MARWLPSIPLILCQLTVWAMLVPVGWWLCHSHCGGPGIANDLAARGPSSALNVALSSAMASAVGHHGAPWTRALLEAIESGASDALGGAGAADKALAAGLPSGLAEEVRALVAKRLKDAKSGDAMVDKPAMVDSNICNVDRGPYPIPIMSELKLPVLDGMGGRVSPAGKEPPNMVANKWGIPMPNITVEVSPGKRLTVDEIVYGYDLLFESMHLFSYVSWGRVPMQQDPADALAIADLISRLQPDCFVELGTNTGGGAIFYAEVMKQYQAKPLVVTIDVHEPIINWDKFGSKVCPHCVPVTCSPTWHEKGLIEFVKGFTQEDDVVGKVDSLLKGRQCKRTVVMHDSDHRGFAVERDLQIYHKFVSPGSYLIVQDTKLSRMRGGRYATFEAVQNFLATPAGKGRFMVDKTFEYQLFSHHHGGFMQRVAPEGK